MSASSAPSSRSNQPQIQPLSGDSFGDLKLKTPYLKVNKRGQHPLKASSVISPMRLPLSSSLRGMYGRLENGQQSTLRAGVELEAMEHNAAPKASGNA